MEQQKVDRKGRANRSLAVSLPSLHSSTKVPLSAIRYFCLLVLLLTSTVGRAQDQINTDVIDQSLESILFQTFTVGLTGNGAVDNAIGTVTKHRSSILLCITENEKELAQLNSTVGEEALNALIEKEDVTVDEAQVVQKAKRLRDRIQECKILLGKTENVLDRLTTLQLEINKQKLLKRNPNLGTLMVDEFNHLPQYVGGLVKTQSALPNVSIKPLSAFAAILAIFGLLYWGLRIRRKAVLPGIDFGVSFSAQITTAVGNLAKRWSPLLMPLIFAVAFMVFFVGYQFTNSNLNKLLLFGIGFVFLQIILRAGVRRYTRYLSDTQNIEFPGQALYIRLVIASCLLSAWVLIVTLGESHELTLGESLFRTLLSISILVSLIVLSRFLVRIPNIPTIAGVGRWVSTGVFYLAIVLEVGGYHNLSRFLWGGIVFSGISLTIFYVFEKMLRDFYDGLEIGNRPWQVRFRGVLSVDDHEPVPGLIWIRLLSIIALWIALGVGVLKAWGTANSGIASIFAHFRNGFKIGDSLLTPFHIVLGIFVFAILLMIFRWFKDGLDKKHLSNSRMDSGAREAMVTITGYLGFIVAALAGLSIAGVGFGNLAIVAGALSLGIGFGLQNIVNNFVSGIILLFERPIKTGDWIVTGSTEGTVKKIRVRSTEVQTFDRSNVIVPNSELISAPVTNWTLRDKYGRVVIPVGVAYGSDTELVEKLLYEVTEDIPEVIKNRPALPIKVLFLAFGDSTLNFELRFFIFDVGSVTDVRSKLHFAIDKAFREHNIEIAFPQRDIHIRSSCAVDANHFADEADES